MVVQQFEDLIAWQKSRALTKKIYEITGQGNFAHDFGLRDQIRRASVSIMSNIAEGVERKSSTEYSRFLEIAKSSSAEVRCQLYVAYDVGYVSDELFSDLMQNTKEVTRILGGLKASIDRRR